MGIDTHSERGFYLWDIELMKSKWEKVSLPWVLDTLIHALWWEKLSKSADV